MSMLCCVEISLSWQDSLIPNWRALSFARSSPPLNDSFETMCNVYFGVDPFFVEPAEQDLMPIRYTPVSDVGADRIVTAVAAFRKLEDSAIVRSR